MRGWVILLGLALATGAGLAWPSSLRAAGWTMPPGDAAEPRPAPRPEAGREAHRPRHERGHGQRPHRRGPGIRVFRVEPVPQVVAPPPDPPAPPEAVVPAAPPPDPQGPLRAEPARGVEAAPERWRIGEALPPDLPHVTLDWRRYDLPEPPSGRIWVRVGRSVLLITAAGRVVEAVLPQG